jgi:hypothetical protein
MITQPSSQRPWFHALCFASLSLLVCLSFGSAQAQEEKPGRTREGERTSPEAAAPRKSGEEKTTVRKGESDGTKKRGEGDGARDGEGAKKSGMRDGEGVRKSAEGDGARKSGMRDGEGGARKAAEGDGVKRTGARDGEGMRKSAEGEGSRKSAEGEGSRKASSRRDGDVPKSGKAIVLRVTDGGDTIVINGEKVEHNRLRGYLSEFLPGHRGDDVTIEADDDVPFKSVADVLDAARDNGAKGAKITSASKSDR